MKIFELILVAVALYYFLIFRPKAIKAKKQAQNQADELKAQTARQTDQATSQGLNSGAGSGTASGTSPVEKMVACEFCKVRLPSSDAIVYQGNHFCSRSHLHQINAQGFLGSCHRVLSPNFDARPAPTNTPTPLVDTIVLHHISLPEGSFGGTAIKAFFCNQLNPEDDPYFKEIAHLKVSTHFLIERSGEITQFVATEQRAWHAGVSILHGREQCNDFSIGIELEGTGEIAFEPEQYQSLVTLTQTIFTKYPISQIVGHSDIAPDRKKDPGQSFDWNYFKELSQLAQDVFPFGLHSR